MTIQEATFFLLNKLRTICSEGEASQITDWVMEHLTGSKKAERMLYKHSAITEGEVALLKDYADRLLQQEPVQYVLNEAWFFGLKFYTDKNVLIPRPETEELVEWIITDNKTASGNLKILDIGTGSGCIPVSLKKKMPQAEVWSIDISEGALQVATKNAATHTTAIHLLQQDILDKENWSQLPMFDIIVSNPPYIPEKDKAEMQANVLQYEPVTALFVPDDDALLFYKAIAAFGKEHLTSNGFIYFEIHEDLGNATVNLLKSMGYITELKKDMQQKDRLAKAGLIK
jgi:release factor glutamine methyltransferase